MVYYEAHHRKQDYRLLLFLLPFANMLFSGKEQALTAIAVCNACACFAALTAAVWEAMMTFMEIAGNSNGNTGGG